MQGRPASTKAIALGYGLACHVLFASAVVTMFLVLRTGMTETLGRLRGSWAVVGNGLLLLQFPVGHSFLLTSRGRRVLDQLAPSGLGQTLRSTTYVAIASVQALSLFLLWTPSGDVWWSATGAVYAAIVAANVGAWLLLAKAIVDAGASLQTGWLGWRAALRGDRPRFPPMPEAGLFRVCRQPIYVAFALTTWTVPVWTPDQAVVAGTLTTYCLFGPLLKEARWTRAFGDRFEAYRRRVPYWLPWPRPRGAR